MSWKPTRWWHTQVVAQLKRTRAYFLDDLLTKFHSPEDAAALNQAAAELVEEGAIRLAEVAGYGVIISRRRTLRGLPG
jgi:hypothetical protein